METRRSRMVVTYDGLAVRSFASLESPVTNALAVGTEVLVEEAVTLPNGRARLRLVAPVEGWVSERFLSKAAPPSFAAGPLSAKVVAAVRARPGNDVCVRCGASLSDDENEAVWADPALGTLFCEMCGAGRCLGLDAFNAAQRKALLQTGNALRLLAKDASDAEFSELICESLSVSAAALRRDENRCACEPRLGELRVLVPREATVTIAETQGLRAVVVKHDAGGGLRLGDYVVGVGRRRAWRFHDVQRLAAAEKKQQATWCLVVRRIPLVHDVVAARATTREEVSCGGPSSFRGHAHHESVKDYWEEKDDEPQLRLAAVVTSDDWSKIVTRDARGRARLRSTVVVGVNGHRHRLTYDSVLAALQSARRPLLLLCLGLPDSSLRKQLRVVFESPGRLGLRLQEADAGVLVVGLDPGGLASRAGVDPGGLPWRLALVDDTPVVHLPQALRLLSRRPCAAVLTPHQHES